MTTTTKHLTVQQAAELLGVPRRRISELIKRGQLHTETNPLDQRSKLIPIAEIERLAELPRAPRRQRAPAHEEAPDADTPPLGTNNPAPSDSRARPRTFGMLSDPGLQSDEIDDYLREHWRPM